VDLDHAAHRHPLGELAAPAGQRRPVGEPAGQRRWDRQDRPLRRDRAARRLDHHAAGVVAHHRHRGAEHHPLAERLGQPDRDRLRPLVEAALLGATGGLQQPRQAAGAADDEQGVEQRQLARLGGQRAAHRGPQPGPRALGGDAGLQPALHRLRVPRRRLVGGPRRLRRHRGGHRVQLTDGQAHGHRGARVAGREPAVVALGAAVAELGVQPAVPGREGGDAKALGQRRDAVLGGADPLAAVVDRRPVGRRQRQRAAADPVAGLQHQHLGAARGQVAGRHQPGEPGADHHHVQVCCGGHRRSSLGGGREGARPHSPRRRASTASRAAERDSGAVLYRRGMAVTSDRPPATGPTFAPPAWSRRSSGP
jgi:hypothetical protein